MSSCTNINVFSDLVEDFITRYEELAADETLSDIESGDTTAILNELYGYRAAIKEDDRAYIEAQGFVGQQQAKRQALLEATFKDILGSTFKFKYKNAQKESNGEVVSIVPMEGGFRLNFLENGRPRSYSFSATSDGRSRDSKATGSYIRLPSFRKLVDNYSIALEAQEQLELIFGSSDGKLDLGEEYRQDDYIHGSIDHMKATLSRLHLLGGSKASQEELDKFNSYIDKMSPEFFNNLKLYIQTEAEKSQGVASAKRIEIAVSSSKRIMGNQQSEAAIYMEEVIHSMTSSALSAKNDPKAVELRRQLSTLIELARRNVTWESFLPSNSINKEAEERQAKWLYNYIFTGKKADYEFIAKALVIPEVEAAFKKIKIKEEKDSRTLLQRVNDFFGAVLDVLKGNITLKQRNQNVHEALVNLAFDLGTINKNANRKVREEGNYLTKVFDVLNNTDANLASIIDEKKEALLGKALAAELGEVPTSLYGRVKYTAKFIGLSMTNPVYTKSMGVIASAWGMKPGSIVREVVGNMFASDTAQQVAEFLTMQAGYIDKLRNNQIDLVRSKTLSEFTDKLTTEQEEALTAVLMDADLAYLFSKESVAKKEDISKTVYNNKTLRKLLTDDATLDRLIKNAKRALKELDTANYHWHSNQAVGLGIYMATHRGTPEQNLNTHNIARGIHSSHRKKPVTAVEEALEELATLVAIKNTSQEQKAIVAELLEKEWKGVYNVADMVEGFKKNSDATVFKGRKTNKIKGYSREVFDDTIIKEVAPLEDRALMESQGFIFKGALAPRAGDVRNKPMALYVTDTAMRPDRLRGGARLNTITSKGTSIKELAYKDGSEFSNSVIRERAQRDINNIERAALARAKKMENGEYDFTDTVFGVVPVLNEEGAVVDYRYMMDKETKKSLLNQDTRISEVLARSYGTILDKDLSSQHNAKVLDMLVKEMSENWTEGSKGNDGLTEYTLIGPKVADPEMRKLYNMLPREFQEYIRNHPKQVLAVRSDLHHLVFGYSHMSVTDLFPMLSKFTPPIILKVIKFAEMMWMEMIKIVKTNILMKMPTILLSNIFSNLVYGMMKGTDPITLMSMYVSSYREISKYNKDVRRVQELENSITELEVAKSRDLISNSRLKALELELKRNKGELEATKQRLQNSSIHELVKLGLDQNVEDLSNDVDRDTNRITSAIDKQLQKAPELVRDGLDILFITKRTTFYKVANEFLEVSDLVARDVQNKIEKRNIQKQVEGSRALPLWWLEQQSKGYKKRQRLTGEERKKFLEEANRRREYDLVEDFINYTKPSSRLEEYLNRVGILMFTKYVKRIQRIIMKNTTNAPLKTALGLFAYAQLGGFPSIHEQSFLAKDWYGNSTGPGNIFPIYSPVENFMNFITPSLLKSSTYTF